MNKLLCFFILVGCSSIPLSRAEGARELWEEGKFEEAVQEYELHIKERKKNPKRPESENPDFYQLFIGDIYLELSKPEQAKAAYQLAKEKEVRKSLIIDRFKRLARWWEDKKEFQKAINSLRPLSDLDPLTVDPEIDRLHRKMVGEEEK